MPHVTLTDPQGQPLRSRVENASAEDLLWAAGVQCGHWAPRIHAVSSLPQLTYARELLGLQQRYATVVTQRSRVASVQRGGARTQEALHVHDDVELRVVLQGVLRLRLPAPTLGAWLDVALHPCEWVALPAGLPHESRADAVHGVDMLCLYTRPGGWRSRPAGMGPARRGPASEAPALPVYEPEAALHGACSLAA